MLKLNNVTVIFDETDLVLDNIDLEVKKGEIVCIIGPSGSGKSTLIRTMTHMVEPTSGTITFKDDVLNKNNINEIRQRIGMVFQAFELFPHLTVLENMILAPVHLKKMSKEEAISKSKELLNRVNLLDKIDAYPNTLSGGQKQRILLITTVLLRRPILLLDEPTSALDAQSVDLVIDYLRSLTGTTIIAISHDPKLINSLDTKIKIG